jgi:hypothetical protein
MSPRRFLLSFLLLAAAAGLAGCAETTEQAETTAAELTNDQEGIDVQVLQVWTPGRFLPLPGRSWLGAPPADVVIDSSDARSCPTVRTVTSTSAETYEDREVDCAAALSAATPLDGTGPTAPAMTPVHFMITKRLSDGYLFVDPDYCNRLELRAVVRDAAMSQPTFAGIGFWSSRGDVFTPKSDLRPVGHVTLAGGEPATVFRFTGISTCVSSAHSSTSGNIFQTFSFKPYAAYEGDDGARYRVWESIRGNHRLGRSWPGETPAVDATAFDRQNELLAR